MKKIVYLAVLAFFLTQVSLAQNKSLQSYQKARKILNDSVAAFGGAEAIRAIKNFSLLVEGDSVHRNQSRSPKVFDRTQTRVNMTIDFENNRFFYEFLRAYPGGNPTVTRDIFDGKERSRLDLTRQTKTISAEPAGWRNGSQLLGWLPQFLLLNAYDRANRLRHFGTISYENRQHEIIVFSEDTGRQTAFYIDAETKLLSKMESVFSDTVLGDAVLEVLYPSYKEIDGFKVPVSRITKAGSELAQEIRYANVSFNKSLTGDLFKVSSEFRVPTADPPNLPVIKFSNNVYTISTDVYNVLCVAFKDYIVVVEAPLGDASSRQVIAKIKETFPGKPIKFLAVTHHHDDHTGGIRTYVSEGVTLVTTKGNQEYFEKISKSQFTITPDTLARNPKPLVMEFVENDKRVFTDGETTLELYNIGPTPHAEEMLVAYLPKEKLLFEADIADKPSATDILFANNITLHFANWLEKKKLEVDKFIAAHGPVISFDEFKKSVAEKRK